jgi:hypothetical protein
MLSANLADLLVVARQDYDWLAGTGAGVSQGRIIALERSVGASIAAWAPASAHQKMSDVSEWAGNNADSHAQIVDATPAQRIKMQDAIRDLLVPDNAGAGIITLCALPGISLVIASKIYRFCSPATGVAVDRHASYFFKSLPVSGGAFSTSFQRESANGRHSGSRLAIYSASRLSRNRDKYLNVYLPLLRIICKAENQVLITLDTDFANLGVYPPEDYSGIIVLRLANQAKPHVLSILARLLDSLSRKSPSGHLWIVDEYRIKIRPAGE